MMVLGWVLTILGWYLVATAAFYALFLPAVVADVSAVTGSVQKILLYVLWYIVIWLALGLALILWGKRLRRRAAGPFDQIQTDPLPKRPSR